MFISNNSQLKITNSSQYYINGSNLKLNKLGYKQLPHLNYSPDFDRLSLSQAYCQHPAKINQPPSKNSQCLQRIQGFQDSMQQEETVFAVLLKL